jgi:Holliday junction resolvasome RuvABC endonuclease subunit
MSRSKAAGLVLAVHPAARGFGWALFEGEMVPVGWGVASAKGNKSAECMRRFEKLLNQYRPSALILENFAKETSRRGERIRTLAQTMRGFANNRDMDVLVYSREEVGTSVCRNTKATRYAVACAVADRLPLLRRELPRPRKYWEQKDDRQCLFDAAALGITHYTLTRPRS